MQGSGHFLPVLRAFAQVHTADGGKASVFAPKPANRMLVVSSPVESVLGFPEG